MKHEYSVVNAFTKNSLAGNPVAVFQNATGLSSEQMQGLAAQFQLSETTFVETQGNHHNVRVFTPVNELSFAGHPLLGTAASLHKRLRENEFELTTAEYEVQAEVVADGALNCWVRLRFPPPRLSYEGEIEGLLDALGIDKPVLPVCIYDAGAKHALVAVEDRTTLLNLRPDLRRLAHLDDLAINCFAFTGTQVENRMFSPAYGVAEDAATGSVVNAIASLLIKHGQLSFDEQIEVTQGTQVRRRSFMYGQLSSRPNGKTEARLSGNTRLFSDGRVHELT